MIGYASNHLLKDLRGILPDNTTMVYREQDLDDTTVCGVHLKNWKQLWGGWWCPRPTAAFVWFPNDNPDHHIIWEFGDTRVPKKIYASRLFETCWDGSRYRSPKTLGEYLEALDLIDKLLDIQDRCGSQEEIQEACKKLKEWGIEHPN